MPTTNNLGLFVTHHVFLTDEQISNLVSGSPVSCLGHCVPVWIDAKTGRTTEPAREVFCSYDLFNSEEKSRMVECAANRGYSVWIPRTTGWTPPDPIDFEEMAGWSSERREEFLKERDAWWFGNPRPPDAEDLSRGYLRFEVKVTDLKVGRRKYSAQHIVEISSVRRLVESLTS
jgi:hypothetical protein